MDNDEIYQRAELDRALANLADSLPPLWRRLYLNTKDQGFTKTESLELLKAYILSQCPFGVNGAK